MSIVCKVEVMRVNINCNIKKSVGFNRTSLCLFSLYLIDMANKEFWIAQTMDKGYPELSTFPAVWGRAGAYKNENQSAILDNDAFYWPPSTMTKSEQTKWDRAMKSCDANVDFSKMSMFRGKIKRTGIYTYRKVNFLNVLFTFFLNAAI